MYEWILANGFHPIIIATKADKINKSQLNKQIMAIKTGLQVDRDTIVIPFSAQTKQGREEIYEVIDSIILNNIPDTTGDDQNEEES
jgi:GTP-binding protein